jgi:putative hemolysin
MPEPVQSKQAKRARSTPPIPYDKRNLSYAGTFTNPYKAFAIRSLEWLSGKLPLLRLVRRFERMGPASGQAFWAQALGLMGIDLLTPTAQIAKIPETGPVVVVANHPHGLVDGMILAELIGRIRPDYKILTRTLLTGVKEIEQFMIPVPFPHEPDARQKSLDMRKMAMEHLSQSGLIVLFPSGVVASVDEYFGPAIEANWNPFTAKLITKSGATVIPIYFPGQNSRLYQIASKVSATIRQGLLLHEVIHACNKPQAPVVGDAIDPEQIEKFRGKPRSLVAWLRNHTLSLRQPPSCR